MDGEQSTEARFPSVPNRLHVTTNALPLLPPREQRASSSDALSYLPVTRPHGSAPGACISPSRGVDTLPSCPPRQGVGTGASGLTRLYLPLADAPHGKEDTGESSVQGVFPHAEPCMTDSPTNGAMHPSPTVSLQGEECLCAGLSTDLFSHNLSKAETDSPPVGGAAFLPTAKAEGLSPRFDDYMRYVT